MDVVEKYHRYNKLLQMMTENKCHGCVKLKEQLVWAKEQKKHKEELNALKFQLSDEALQQMPDFQGRVCLLIIIFLALLFDNMCCWKCDSIWVFDLLCLVDECNTYEQISSFNPSSRLFSGLEEFWLHL